MSNRLDGFCNAYGSENPGGHAVAFGGFLQQPIAQQHYCRNRAVHRFRWICARGHEGPIVALCEQHYLEFTGSREVPWNVRRDVQACPRCASLAPECDNPEHQRMMRGQPGRCGCREEKTSVRLVTVS